MPAALAAIPSKGVTLMISSLLFGSACLKFSIDTIRLERASKYGSDWLQQVVANRQKVRKYHAPH